MAKNSKTEYSWERQQGETAQAFEAFTLYCKMGDERILGKVGKKLGKSATLIERWSSQWNWVNRCRDYDNEIRRQEVRADKKAFQEMKKRQIGMAVELQNKAFEAFKALPVKALSPKDIKEFMKLGAELERENLSAVNSEENDKPEAMTIDIYLPEKDDNHDE